MQPKHFIFKFKRHFLITSGLVMLGVNTTAHAGIQITTTQQVLESASVPQVAPTNDFLFINREISYSYVSRLGDDDDFNSNDSSNDSGNDSADRSSSDDNWGGSDNSDDNSGGSDNNDDWGGSNNDDSWGGSNNDDSWGGSNDDSWGGGGDSWGGGGHDSGGWGGGGGGHGGGWGWN